MEQAQERHKVVEAGVAGSLAGGALNPTVLAMIDAAEAVYPHRVAIDDGDRQLSPYLLGITVRRLARAILDLAPPGPIGIGLREGGMGIVATLAVLATGRDCVLLDPVRLPDAARGCACLVSDPGDGVIPPSGCVGIDVFLSCCATYAEAGPPLPDVAADAVAVRFGAIDGEALTLERLVSGACRDGAPHPPVSGLLSCPRCLGDALAALSAGSEVRMGAGDGCGEHTVAGIYVRR